MHSLISSVVAVALLSSSLSLAQPEGEVVIHTRDGRSRQGRVISETQKGYLFATSKGTSVIAFDSIVDIKNVGATEAATAPVPPPAPVAEAAPSAPPPPPTSTSSQRAPDMDFSTPPPPPTRPAEVSVASEQSAQNNSRKGFHFGLGAFVGANNGGLSTRAEANFEFNFGLPEYRASLNLGYLNMYGIGVLNAHADNLLQLNFGDVFALAFGVEVGVVTGVGTYFYGAPVLQPVIIKLGDRGQHRLTLSGSLAVLSTYYCRYSSSDCLTWAGTLQVTAGYSFYF